MKVFDHYKFHGLLIGSRAFGIPGKYSDWDLVVLETDLLLEDLECDDSGNYGELADGVDRMFYKETENGLLNIQVVKHHITILKLQSAANLMHVLPLISDKTRRIEKWRLAMTMADVQEYKPYVKKTFLQRLNYLFKGD